MLRKFVFTFTLLMFSSLPIFAEESNTAADVFIGASVQGHGHVGGWNASAAVHITDWFSIVGEAGAHYPTVGLIQASFFTSAVGARVSFRTDKKFIPFIQTTFGANRTSATLLDASASGSGPIITVGAGADWMFSNRVGVRIGQYDYRVWHLEGVSNSAERFSTGLVFRF